MNNQTLVEKTQDVSPVITMNERDYLNSMMPEV